MEIEQFGFSVVGVVHELADGSQHRCRGKREYPEITRGTTENALDPIQKRGSHQGMWNNMCYVLFMCTERRFINGPVIMCLQQIMQYSLGKP